VLRAGQRTRTRSYPPTLRSGCRARLLVAAGAGSSSELGDLTGRAPAARNDRASTPAGRQRVDELIACGRSNPARNTAPSWTATRSKAQAVSHHHDLGEVTERRSSRRHQSAQRNVVAYAQMSRRRADHSWTPNRYDPRLGAGHGAESVRTYWLSDTHGRSSVFDGSLPTRYPQDQHYHPRLYEHSAATWISTRAPRCRGTTRSTMEPCLFSKSLALVDMASVPEQVRDLGFGNWESCRGDGSRCMNLRGSFPPVFLGRGPGGGDPRATPLPVTIVRRQPSSPRPPMRNPPNPKSDVGAQFAASPHRYPRVPRRGACAPLASARIPSAGRTSCLPRGGPSGPAGSTRIRSNPAGRFWTGSLEYGRPARWPPTGWTATRVPVATGLFLLQRHRLITEGPECTSRGPPLRPIYL